MRRFSFILLFVAVLFGIASADAQKKNIDNLKKEKQTLTREINDTNKKIKKNTRETSKQLNRLDALRADMKKQDVIITSTRRSADSIASAITTLGDSIKNLEQQLSELRRSYSKSLRKMQTLSVPSSAWGFVLSASDFNDAWSRIRYLRQLSTWRNKKAEAISNLCKTLSQRRGRLDTLAVQRGHALQRLDLASQQLARQQKETQSVVASLKKEESSLRAYLKEKKEQSKRLDRQIDKLIAEEQARQEAERKRRAEAEKKKKLEQEKAAKAKQKDQPAKKDTEKTEKKKEEPVDQYAEADRKLTGSFESNKGRLLFPVTGKYRIVRPFGRQQHPELEHVETENSGIDIAVSKGAVARAVFEGKVSAIFQQAGFNTIVMVRHGAYLTIYAGLSSVSVRNDQTLKAGQTIGSIATDPDNDNQCVLHFELRREREKLNPSLWVK